MYKELTPKKKSLNNKVISTGSGHRFVTMETSRFHLISPFCPEGSDLFSINKYAPQGGSSTWQGNSVWVDHIGITRTDKEVVFFSLALFDKHKTTFYDPWPGHRSIKKSGKMFVNRPGVESILNIQWASVANCSLHAQLIFHEHKNPKANKIRNNSPKKKEVVVKWRVFFLFETLPCPPFSLHKHNAQPRRWYNRRQTPVGRHKK